MVAKLIVRVQADLLPQITNSAGNIVSQVGVRLSALVDAAPGDALPNPIGNLLPDLCPWRWLSADPAITTKWNPHDPAAWRLFKLDAAGPIEITAKLPTPAGLDPGMDADLAFALDQSLAMLVDESGEAAVRLPPDDRPIENRTVFGMVESLTGLPHPVPAGMRVFSVLSVAEDLSDIRLVAVPRFRLPVGGGFDIDAVTFGALDPKDIVTADAVPTDASPWASGVQFQLRASLTKSEMVRAANSPRLLDLFNLSVGKNADGTETGDEDYVAHLPARLAEAIDPAARLIGAFDGAVEALRISSDPADQSALSELATDLRKVIAGGASDAMTLLEAMTADVFLPTARASEAFPSVALSRFGVLARERDSAGSRSEAAQNAGQVFLRMLDRDKSDIAFAAGRMRHPIMSFARLAAVAGLTTEEVAAAPKQASALDSEAGLLEFVSEHWLAPYVARPLTLGVSRRLAAKSFSAATLDLTMQYEPVLDAEMLAAPGPRFALRLEALGDAAKLTIGATAISFERTDLGTGGNVGKIAVSSSGGAPISVDAPVGEPLSFALNLSADRSTLSISFDSDPQTLETLTPDLARGPFEIMLEAVAGLVADFQPQAATPVYVQRIQTLLKAQGARGDLSLAFAGPYLPGILAGRQDWSSTPWPSSPDGFAKAIRDGVAALVNQLYPKLASQVTNPGWLTPLIGRLVEFAGRDVVQLAVSAVPSATLDRITMDASPLVVRIDQFRDFGTDDAWRRVAGYGALLGRTLAAPSDGASPDAWWTLNAAELQVVAPKNPANPKTLQVVDPVAIQVGEGSGVRQSLLSYNNRWLATGLLADTQHGGPGGQTSGPRRPERLEPPPEGYTLPALSFGYSYWVLPYLIGHGGVLPLWLRADPDNPLVRRGVLGRPVADKLNGPNADARIKTYLRTRPIGSPRYIDTPGKPALPGVPDDLAPLAAELPIRPAPVTLDAGGSALFFRDASGQRGTLSWQPPADGQLAGFRILVGDVCKPGSTYEVNRTPVPQLQVVLWGTKGDEMSPEPLWDTTLPNVVHDLRLSFFIGDGANLTVRIETQSAAPKLTEDEGSFRAEFDTPAIGDWKDMFVEIAVPQNQAPVQFEPPVVTLVQRGLGDDLKLVDSVTTSKPLVAPEASHRSRLISIVDGIRGVAPSPLTLRRPGVEFGTYERWINPALIETSGGPELHKTPVKTALNAAHAFANAEPATDGAPRDVSFEDPAVTAFCFELVEIFPRNRPIGIQVTAPITGNEVFAADPSTLSIGNRRLAQVEFGFATIAALQTSSSTSVKALLQTGRIYELRSYAVVPEDKQAFSPFETLARLSDPVSATLRRVSVGGKSYTLASPNVATIEVATAELPALYEESGWSEDARLIALDRPPMHRDDTARIYLPKGLVEQGARQEELYRVTRYAATASLYSQRWSWRGHPQAEIAARAPSQTLLNSKWVRTLADTAFTGRRDEDVGDIIVRRLERAHVYGGRPNLDEPLPDPFSTALFTKSLDWRAGLNLWRFGLSLTSRYASLFPRKTSTEKLAHLAQDRQPAWAIQAVPDRPSSRSVARPGLALVLPLTEPLMAGGATPPLLALFNERVYANFNLADGIDVAVEVARHPFTAKEQREELERLKNELERLKAEDPVKNAEAIDELERVIAELEHVLDNQIPSDLDALKHWQEFGPDPIRTGAAHDGSPILLRTDGPLGYTFDAETEAGRFDHAGLLVSPVAQQYRPWSMIKLRFRRLEAPESLFGFDPVKLSAADVSVPLSGHRFPPKAVDASVDYEGLLVELASLKKGDTTELALALGAYDVPSAPPPGAATAAVKIVVSRGDETLTISAETWLGKAGTTTIRVEPQESVAVRLVISGRERPEGVEKWTPQGDVAIKLRVADARSGDDVLERLDRDHWLAVNSVPLSGREPVGQDVVLGVSIRNTPSAGTPLALLSPVRLSPFTPSVWCQFAESMSVLAAEVGSSDRPEARLVTIGELRAQPSADMSVLEVSLRPVPGDPPPPAILSLATGSRTDVDAQVDQVLLAVVTRYVTDAFARLRERPIGVIHLTDLENLPLRAAKDTPYTVALKTSDSETAWWGDEASPIERGKGGRLRFLRLLVPRTRELGGFIDAPARRFADLFSETLLTPDDLNPADAAGQILGISQPIEW
ncbi:hypothetical protein [Mesorhizobium sp.]|uniref:hypothetical protein n=1 Tax=Mesorhizobium sp. TaxID=1871066 RepID=UPI0011FBB7A3|nr:hypothetical protein [Mesorhizobium sp.]TIL66503.1 MAG: hypothetical protein E5Y77_16260 [Mesorhizobium sp.]